MDGGRGRPVTTQVTAGEALKSRLARYGTIIADDPRPCTRFARRMTNSRPEVEALVAVAVAVASAEARIPQSVESGEVDGDQAVTRLVDELL